MFTGIITDIGTIERAEHRGDLRLRIGTRYDLGGVALGASIACSGACLTVVDKGMAWFDADLSRETIDRTVPNRWREGARLNLERALRVGDELGGHIVTGHVDGIGTVVDVSPEGDSHRIGFALPGALASYVAPKGSVTIDGVSLTVNAVADQADGGVQFAINIIPHTAEHTTLGELAPGDHVNVEIDVLARYLGRMEQLRNVR